MAEMSSPQPGSPQTDRRASIAPSLSSLQREVESLQAQLADASRKSEKEVKALHQEVSELEALVESKIYKEEELEGVIENLRKSAHGSNGHSQQALREEDDKCEMCGELGHTLDFCPEFETGSLLPSSPKKKAPLRSPSLDWCDDCEVSARACTMRRGLKLTLA